MGYNRLAKRNKTIKKPDVFVVKKGVRYKVLDIAGKKMEIRVAGQPEIVAMKAEFAAFKKNPIGYTRKANSE